MSCLPRNLMGGVIPSQDELEDLVRADYEITHPGDTFSDFKHRSTFDKYDMGLMKDWLAIAAVRHASKLELERQTDRPAGDASIAVLNSLSSS